MILEITDERLPIVKITVKAHKYTQTLENILIKIFGVAKLKYFLMMKDSLEKKTFEEFQTPQNVQKGKKSNLHINFKVPIHTFVSEIICVPKIGQKSRIREPR